MTRERKVEHLKKLEWAVWFAQAKLDGFREGDWLNLKEDLYRYCNVPDTGETASGESTIRVLFDAEFDVRKPVAAFQKELRQCLTLIAFSGKKQKSQESVDVDLIRNANVYIVAGRPDRPFQQFIQVGAAIAPIFYRSFIDQLL